MKNEHNTRIDRKEEVSSRKSHPVIEVGKVIIRNEFYKRSDKSWKKDLEEEKNT